MFGLAFAQPKSLPNAELPLKCEKIMNF